MSIQFEKGDLFSSDADALVNAVNTVGIMGGGIAAQFKERFPEYFQDYKAECKSGNVKLGRMHVYPTRLERPRFIVNFPTKGHWKSDSIIANVETGLQQLRWVIYAVELESVAIPALGCGLGGLDWAEVRPLMLDALSGIDECEVRVFEPR